MIELRPEFRFSSQIRPILPGVGSFCLNLAHFGWIWAILLGFGPYSLDLGPKGDKALRVGWGDGRTYGRTDGWTDSPCVLQDFVPFGAAAKKSNSVLTSVNFGSVRSVRHCKLRFWFGFGLPTFGRPLVETRSKNLNRIYRFCLCYSNLI